MNAPFNHLTRDRLVKRSFLAAILLLCVGLVYTAVTFSNLPPLIPMFNQLPWGTARLADKVFIFLPIVITSIILIGNMIFSQLVYEKMPLIVRMISITSFFISFVTCIFIIRTTLLLF